MKINNVKAKIKGLNSEPYYFKHHCYWAWDILFEDSTDLHLENLIVIYLDKDRRKAIDVCNEFKDTFKTANIFEGAKITILSDEKGQALAIKGNCNNKFWIDVRDKFKIKKFSELNIKIDDIFMN